MSAFISARYGRAAQYLLHAERSSDALFVLAADEEASCLHAGGCARSLTGLACEQLERQGLMMLVVREDRAAARSFLRAVLASADPLETEWRIRGPVGHGILVHVLARRVLDPLTGEPVEIVASLGIPASVPQGLPRPLEAEGVAAS
jgi:PAS domain-containing protein